MQTSSAIICLVPIASKVDLLEVVALIGYIISTSPSQISSSLLYYYRSYITNMHLYIAYYTPYYYLI